MGLVFGHLLFAHGFVDRRIEDLLNHNTLPLWKDKRYVVNIDRAFFHLDDSNHNKPDLLYHGLYHYHLYIGLPKMLPKCSPMPSADPHPKPPNFMVMVTATDMGMVTAMLITKHRAMVMLTEIKDTID